MRYASDIGEPCELPEIKLTHKSKPNCLNPILWGGVELEESSEKQGEYIAVPPEPLVKGHWVGYYVEIYWKGDTPADYPD